MKKTSARTRIMHLLEEYENRDLFNDRISSMEHRSDIAA